MGQQDWNQLGKPLFIPNASIDPRELVNSVNDIINIDSAYVGMVVTVKGDNNIQRYKIKKVTWEGHPDSFENGGYELIQEPKDLKYSDNTSFLNSDNEINIDTLKSKNIPELQLAVNGWYFTISNNVPWEKQALEIPSYRISGNNMLIIFPSLVPEFANFGNFSQALINEYDVLDGKQLEISVFDINKCSNGYLSSDFSYKFIIPLNINSTETIIKCENGIDLECEIGINSQSNKYGIEIVLPDEEPNPKDYRVMLSFSNIQDLSGKADKVTGDNLDNKLASLDVNGNIKSSGITLNALREELGEEYVQKPSTDPINGQILSYNETNETTEWIDNTTVHIKYAATDTPTSNDMHDSIQPVDLYIGIYSDNNFSDSTSYTDYKWSRIVGIDGTNGIDGKNAFEVWKETTGRTTANEADYIEDLQTKVAKWIPVAYEATTASATIGDTVTFTTAPSNPIDGAIVLMPNAASSATVYMMFAVSEDPTTQGAYIYTYIGDLNVDTTGLLGIGDVDNTHLTNPLPNALTKAADVKGIKNVVEGGVTEEESNVAGVTGYYNWYPSGADSSVIGANVGSKTVTSSDSHECDKVTLVRGGAKYKIHGRKGTKYTRQLVITTTDNVIIARTSYRDSADIVDTVVYIDDDGYLVMTGTNEYQPAAPTEGEAESENYVIAFGTQYQELKMYVNLHNKNNGVPEAYLHKIETSSTEGLVQKVADLTERVSALEEGEAEGLEERVEALEDVINGGSEMGWESELSGYANHYYNWGTAPTSDLGGAVSNKSSSNSSTGTRCQKLILTHGKYRIRCMGAASSNGRPVVIVGDVEVGGTAYNDVVIARSSYGSSTTQYEFTLELTEAGIMKMSSGMSVWSSLTVTEDEGMKTIGENVSGVTVYLNYTAYETNRDYIAVDKEVVILREGLEERIEALEGEDEGGAEYPDLYMPNDIYVVKGDILRIYKQNILKAHTYEPWNLYFVSGASAGYDYPRFFYMPTSGLNAGSTITVTAVLADNNGNVIKSKATTVHVVAKPVSRNFGNILILGASTIEDGVTAQEVGRRLTASNGTPVGFGCTASMVGRVQVNSTNVEAIGGKSWDYYAGTTSSGVAHWKFVFAVGTSIVGVTVGDTLSIDGTSATVTVTEKNEGDSDNAPYIRGIVTNPGGDTIPASGVVGGVSYVSRTQDISGNPLAHDGAIDFANYSTAYCGGVTIDMLVIWLGGNSLGSATYGTLDKIGDLFAEDGPVKRLIRAYHSYNSNGKVVLTAQHLASRRGGLASSKANVTLSLYNYMYRSLVQWKYAEMLEQMCSDDEFAAYCIFCDCLTGFDGEYLYPATASDQPTRNNRTSTKEDVQTNGVHPLTAGKKTYADLLIPVIVS